MGETYGLALVAGLRTIEPAKGGSIVARYAAGDYSHLPEAQGADSLFRFLRNVVGRKGPVGIHAPHPHDHLNKDPDDLILGADVVSVTFRYNFTVASDPCSPEQLEAALASAKETLAKLGIMEPPRLYLLRFRIP